MTTPNNRTQANKWYNKTGVVVLLLLLFFPIGLIALWKNTNISIIWKTIVTVIYATLIGWCFMPTNSSSNYSAPEENYTAKSEEANKPKLNNQNPENQSSVTSNPSENNDIGQQGKNGNTEPDKEDDDYSIFDIFSYHLKSKYSCNCEEEAAEFKSVDYKKLVAKWGEPNSINLHIDNLEPGEDPYYSVIWEKSGLFNDSKSIMMKFDILTDSELYANHPIGRPNKVYCESQPYLANDGQMHTSWNGPY